MFSLSRVDFSVIIHDKTKVGYKKLRKFAAIFICWFYSINLLPSTDQKQPTNSEHAMHVDEFDNLADFSLIFSCISNSDCPKFTKMHQFNVFFLKAFSKKASWLKEKDFLENSTNSSLTMEPKTQSWQQDMCFPKPHNPQPRLEERKAWWVMGGE